MSQKRPSDHQQPEHHKEGTQKRTVDGKINVNGSIKVDFSDDLRAERRDEKSDDTTQKNKEMFWTRLTFWALIAYTTCAAIQAFASYQAAVAAQEATTTASNTLKQTKDAFVIEQRPYMVLYKEPQFVYPPGFVPNQMLRANAYVNNIGHSPALKIWHDEKLLKYEGLPFERREEGLKQLRDFFDSAFNEMKEREAKDRKDLVLHPNEGIDRAPQDQLFSSTQNEVSLTPAEFDKVRGPVATMGLYLVGVITYTDRFGNSYETDYCRFYIGNDPALWHICDPYNKIK